MPLGPPGNWNANQFGLNFSGVQILAGPGTVTADGDFFTLEPDGPAFEVTKCTDGSIVFNATNNNLWHAELTLMQTSPLNAVMSGFLTKDTQSPVNGAGVGLMSATDLQGTTRFRSNAMRLVSWPKLEFGRGPKTRQWKWSGQGDLIVVGGN